VPHTESLGSIFGYVKYAHGLYNGLVILLFLYQGWLGLKIRQSRIAGTPPVVTFIRRHRKFGPALVILGIFGFAGGISTVYFTEGEIFEHPVHFLTGLTICALIITAFLVSRKIRGRENGMRKIHYSIGLIILSLYFFQAYLGIDMLF
jgi:hypothetical protein